MKNNLFVLFFFFPICFYAQFGEQQIIDDEIKYTWSIFVTDVDGDGYLDVLATDGVNSKVVWYKNVDGLGTFGSQQIVSNNLENTQYVTAADIDGDGDMDVLATALFIDLVVWYENLDGLGTFGQQIVIANLDLPKMAIAKDVDGDGDLDVLIASKYDNKLTWYENTDGLGSFGPQQIISNNAQATASVFMADIDGDGDGDVVSDRSSNGFPCWYENLDDLGAFGAQQEITQDTSGSVYVLADDVDNDGDMDVLNIEAGGNTIAWYKNTDGLGNFGPKQIITNFINAPRKIVMADLDNDGDKDIIYNSHGVVDPDFLAWRANDGLGNFGVQQTISIDVGATRGIFAADIDNDGYVDVLSSSLSPYKVAWYKNISYLNVADVALQTIRISPNPVKDVLQISSENEEDIKAVTMYSVLGTKLMLITKNFKQIEVANLTKGVYFVKIETHKGAVVKKIIKE